MTPELTQEMVDGQDDMAGLLRAPQPAFEFPPSGIKHERAPKIVRLKGLVTIRPQGIPITGRVEGEADMHRRAALCKAGI